MNTDYLTKFGAMSAVVGGGLRIATSFVPYVESPPLEVLYALIDLLLLVGLTTVYLSRSELVGRFGFAGFSLAIVGLASIVGPDPTAFGIDFYRLGAQVIAVGLAAASLSLLRARTLTLTSILWLLAPLPALVPDAIGFATAGMLFGAGFVAAGWHLLIDFSDGIRIVSAAPTPAAHSVAAGRRSELTIS